MCVFCIHKTGFLMPGHKYPDMLAHSSLLLLISGNLLQVFAVDLQQWFKFDLAITDDKKIEPLLTTSYAIMNDKLYICYADMFELYYIDMEEINDAIITQSQPAKVMTLNLTLTLDLCPVNYIAIHEDYLVALFINTEIEFEFEEKYIRWGWYYNTGCGHWHTITSFDPYIDGQWFTMENGKAAVANLSASWSFWDGWDITIAIHEVQLSELKND